MLSFLLLLVLTEKPVIQYPLPAGIHTSEILEITPDSILINQFHSIFEFDLEGRLINEFAMEEGYGIDTFAYLPETNLIAVALFRKTSAGVEREIRLYDRNDHSYTKGFAPFLKGKPFRQFLPTHDGRLFLNLWNREYETMDGSLLVEVEFFSHPEGVELRQKGLAFHEQRKDSEPWSFAFKLRWLVADSSNIVVINHLEPMLRRYGVVDLDCNPLTIEYHLAPLNWFFPDLPWDSDNEHWKHSFSKNVGLNALQNGFLYVYEGPNPDYSDHAHSVDEENRDVPIHTLYLQRLKRDGSLREDPVAIPGAFYAGMIDHSAVVIVKTSDLRYMIHKLDWKK